MLFRQKSQQIGKLLFLVKVADIALEYGKVFKFQYLLPKLLHLHFNAVRLLRLHVVSEDFDLFFRLFFDFGNAVPLHFFRQDKFRRRENADAGQLLHGTLA